MIKEEIKSLLHNKLLLVVLAAIILIPSIYAGLFLSSMWDPYGDLEYLPVAVVNKDVSVEYKDETLSVGKELADELATNDSMAFNIVDEYTAWQGLDNGTYYMVITIPENFSECAATVMDEQPQKMVLEYATNPGKNYISMKLGESAMKQIKENIMEKVSKTYTEAVFESLGDVAEGFDKAADGTLKIVDGTDKLIAGNTEITDNLNKLSEGATTFQEGSEKLNSGLKDYMDGTTAINEGALKLNAGAEKLDSSVPEYTNGVATAANGSKQLVANNAALVAGVDTVINGVTQLNDGTNKIQTGLETMKNTLAESLTKEKTDSINAAISGLVSLNDYIQQLNTAVNGEDNALDKMTTSLTGVGSNVKGAGEDLVKIGNDLQSAGQYTTAAGENAKAAGEKVTIAATDIGAVLTYMQTAQTTTLNPEQVGQLKQALAALADPTGQSEDTAAVYLAGVGENLTKTGESITSAGTNTSNAGDKLSSAGQVLTALGNSDGITTLKSSVKQIANGADTLLKPASEGMSSLLKGLQNVQTALVMTEKDNGKAGLLEGIKKVNNGFADLKNGLSGDKGLKNGIVTYTEGVTTLNNGLAELAGHNTDLNDGVNQLKEGTNDLANGTSKLISNNETILNGANELKNGAADIADGSVKLAEGSKTLGEGLVSLKEGSTDLNDALVDGASEVRENQAKDQNIDMMVAPVETKETMVTEVANNGHAMAAYMLSVGLWVGCLAFCLMYPLVEYKGELKNGLAWWASKAIIAYPCALLMSLVSIIVLHLFLGFEPVNVLRTFRVAAIAVTAFMAIMYFFNITFGKVGSFIMLVFMVLQLAGSAGTYPIEISGELANKLHKFMPFTYTVDAFRSAIAGGNSVLHEIKILGILAVVFTLLTIGVFEIRCHKIRNDKKMIYEWIEEKGLA